MTARRRFATRSTSLRLQWLLSLLVFVWFSGCQTLKGPVKDDIRIQFLRVSKKMTLPEMCSTPLEKKRLLLLFASQYCTHCHRMMGELHKHSSELKSLQIQPVVLWTDLPNCLKAKMAGAHYPDWPFGLPDPISQQQWAVSATPVLYLLRAGRPVLRIDGALSSTKLLKILRKTLRSSP